MKCEPPLQRSHRITSSTQLISRCCVSQALFKQFNELLSLLLA